MCLFRELPNMVVSFWACLFFGNREKRVVSFWLSFTKERYQLKERHACESEHLGVP